jgi:hypothetical protein
MGKQGSERVSCKRLCRERPPLSRPVGRTTTLSTPEGCIICVLVHPFLIKKAGGHLNGQGKNAFICDIFITFATNLFLMSKW